MVTIKASKRRTGKGKTIPFRLTDEYRNISLFITVLRHRFIYFLHAGIVSGFRKTYLWSFYGDKEEVQRGLT